MFFRINTTMLGLLTPIFMNSNMINFYQDIILWYVFACYDFFATILDKHLSLANTFVITSLVTLNLIPGLEHGFDLVWFISNIN
jgi:hypothetical protein